MHYFLRIADDVGKVIIRPISCNLNLLESDSNKSLELGIKIGISANTTSMRKNIHEIALTENLIDAIIEFSNHSDFVHYFDKLPAFQEELIPTISQSHFAKSESSHILEVLPSNSNFKATCNLIYLILLLNQLQYFIVKGILDHTIKNKEKMFLDFDH